MIKTKKNNILVVEDDAAHRAMLTTLLSRWGYLVTALDDGGPAVSLISRKPFDAILMDIRMLKVSGLQALTEIQAINPALPVIIMTAYASVETALAAWKSGAYDYLVKPLDFDKLQITLARALEHSRLKEENQALKASLSERLTPEGIIGRSAAMRQVLELASQVAPTEATVLISGESGTGKEMIAGFLHYHSRRREGPFIKLNCAALVETLLEAELFGYEKGSFTGASQRREGKFRLAQGGSIFLDEVSEMSPQMQVKLLRVIQEREVTRVGGAEAIPVDIRLIAATNRNLKELVNLGLFREDLYYRLNVVGITLPPLRERAEDIPLLARHFLDVFAGKNGRLLLGFTPGAMEALIRHPWPGNVRELANSIERAVVLSRGEYLGPEDLALLTPAAPEEAIKQATETIDRIDPVFPLEEVEKQTILKTLAALGGNKSQAARKLGITRRTLYKKLQSYGVDP